MDLLVDLGRRLEGDAGRRDDRDVFGDVGGEVAFVLAPHEQVRAADDSCHQGSPIRIWAEAADDSAAFEPSMRGSLCARTRTAASRRRLVAVKRADD